MMEWVVWMKWIGTDKEIKKLPKKEFLKTLFFCG